MKAQYPTRSDVTSKYEDYLDKYVCLFCRRRGLSYADCGDDIKQEVRVEMLDKFRDRPDAEQGSEAILDAIRKAANKYTQRAARAARHPLWKQAGAFEEVELMEMPERTSRCPIIVEEVCAMMREELTAEERLVLIVHGARQENMTVEEVNTAAELTGVTLMSDSISEGALTSCDRQRAKRARDRFKPFIQGGLWALLVAVLLSLQPSSLAKEHQGAQRSNQRQTACIGDKIHQG